MRHPLPVLPLPDLAASTVAGQWCAHPSVRAWTQPPGPGANSRGVCSATGTPSARRLMLPGPARDELLGAATAARALRAQLCSNVYLRGHCHTLAQQHWRRRVESSALSFSASLQPGSCSQVRHRRPVSGERWRVKSTLRVLRAVKDSKRVLFNLKSRTCKCHCWHRCNS